MEGMAMLSKQLQRQSRDERTFQHLA